MVSGTLTTKSNLTVSGTADISGPATFRSSLETSGNLSVGTTLQAASGVAFAAYLILSGSAIFKSYLEVSGFLSVGGSIHGGLTSVAAVNASTFTGASGVFQSGLDISGKVVLQSGGPMLFGPSAALEGRSDAIFISGAFKPNATSIVDLGDNTQLPFRDLFLGGKADVDGSIVVGSGIFPMSAATVSTGAPNIGGANASQKFGTIFAASTNIGDIGFSDERCEICGLTFNIGEQVTILLKGGVSGADSEGNRWRYVGGPPIHGNHLIASMIQSAMACRPLKPIHRSSKKL